MRERLLFLSVLLAVQGCSSDENGASTGTSDGGSSNGGSGQGGNGQGGERARGDVPQVGGGLTGGGGAGGNVGGAGTGGDGGGVGVGGGSDSGSLHYTVNAQLEHDFGHQLHHSGGLRRRRVHDGAVDQTRQLVPVGPVSGGAEQLTNWSNVDNEPYVSGSWWYDGNFLLDGHNNANFGAGTFSLQFYGSGRVRWLFGDGAPSMSGNNWQVGPYPASQTPSLLDGGWHHLALVRRWVGASDAQLELWIDGSMVDSEQSEVRTDMRQWFDNWSGFPGSQEGWFWGTEKQAVVGILNQYEDYKGLVARSPILVACQEHERTHQRLEPGDNRERTGAGGLVPRMNEGTGTTTCDVLAPATCMTLNDMKPGYWIRKARRANNLSAPLLVSGNRARHALFEGS